MKAYIDFMKTPMAAPETAGLRTMRFTLLVAGPTLAATIFFLAPLRAVFGNAIVGVAAALLLLLLVLAPVYIRRKNRADDRHMDDVLGIER